MPRRNDPGDGAGAFEPWIGPAQSAFQQLSPGAQILVVVLILALGALAAFLWVEYAGSAGWQPPVGGESASAQANFLLGNPSGARPDPDDRDNFLLVKPYYTLSYNNDEGIPNWVSWRLSASDLGSSPRKPEFDPDSTLPAGFKVVVHGDYSGSGFDRGHMCPHSDRAANEAMSFATFVMTNIIPQAPNVNRKAWAQEEDYLRGLVEHDGSTLYIVAGPLGRGGTGSAGFRDSIAGGKVTVPAGCWKVAVVVNASNSIGDDRSAITASSRVITVLMPNDNGTVGEEWAGFRTSPAEVERQTGLHFFDRLSPATAAALRQKIDSEPIAPPRPMYHRSDRDAGRREPARSRTPAPAW